LTREHRYALAGTVEWRSLIIEVYVCEDCERVKTYKKSAFRVGI